MPDYGSTPSRSTLKKAQHRLDSMKRLRTDFEGALSDLSTHLSPRRYKDFTRKNRGKRVTSAILDPAPVYARRTLQSGMMAGITSPARPWFRLATFDPELREFGPVKQHLNIREKIMRETFQASNIYNFLHTVYGDIGWAGQFGGGIFSDPDHLIRGDQYRPGEYWLAADDNHQIDTMGRRADMSVEQTVARFGLGNVSKIVRQMYDKGDYDENIEVMSLIGPRDREKQEEAREEHPAEGRLSLPIYSYWWEEGAKDEDGLLSEGGYIETPIIAPRWEDVGDTYGYGPGWDVLPDAKQLQSMTRRKNEAIEKQVRPPMQGPTSARQSSASLMPGHVTYLDDPTGMGLKPLIENRTNLQHLTMDIEQTKENIREGFYADLWLMLTNSTRREITAREIEERHEEKLIALGPVLERLQQELLRPIIERTSALLERAGKFPEAPQELQGEGTLKVEYISMLAQAQKAVATGSVERLTGFAAAGFEAFPRSRHKINFDQAIDEMGDMLGVPPKIIRSDDEVDALNAKDDKAMQQQQQMMAATEQAGAAQQGAGAVKQLAEATQGGSAQDLLSRLGLSTP